VVRGGRRTWLLDSAVDAVDLWNNIKGVGKYLLGYTLVHPKMKFTDLGEKVNKIYKEKHNADATRLVYVGFDGMWVLADAIKRAGATDKEKIIKALEASNCKGTRGQITFSKEPGHYFNQWVNIPQQIYQFLEVGQDRSQAPIVWPPEMATAKPIRPTE